jgi:hypothetical protein
MDGRISDFYLYFLELLLPQPGFHHSNQYRHCPVDHHTLPARTNSGTTRFRKAKHLLGLVEDVGEVALAAVLTVVHSSHEDTGTALDSLAASSSFQKSKVTYLGGGALAAETLDLAIAVNLVVLEDSELGLLALVLDLLGGGVDLLLALLATTTQAEHEVQGRLLLNVVIREGTAVLELLASEDQALLVGGNSLLVWFTKSD